MINVMFAGQFTELVPQLQTLLPERYRLHLCMNGPEVLAEFWALQPELLVIDLTMPGCDTVGLLRAVQTRCGHTQVLAATCSYNAHINDLLSMVDTAFLLIQPFAAETVATRLLQLEHLLPESGVDVDEIMQELGLDSHAAGFPCLCAAIGYKLEYPDCLYYNDLCVYVANCRGGTPLSVDKAMIRCIRKAWRRRDPILWAHYLGADLVDITNAQFIKAIASYITNKK